MGNDEKTLVVRGAGDDDEPLFHVEVVIRSDDGGAVNARNYQYTGDRDRDREVEIVFMEQAAKVLLDTAKRMRRQRPPA